MLADTVSSDELQDAAHKPLLLLTDENVKDAFLRTDVTVLRAAWKNVCIPPPGYQQQLQPGEEQEGGEVFECGLREEDGTICGKVFDSKQKLLVHQTLRRGGEHGARRISTLLIVANQCVCCKAIFKSTLTARNHFAGSIVRGYCRPELEKGSITRSDVQEPANLVCGVCDLACSNFIELQWHLCTHLPDGFGCLV